MDPVFASVVLGFFSLTMALVAISIAIAYRQSDIAREVIKNPGKLSELHTSDLERSDTEDGS